MAYTATVTSPLARCERISPSLGIYAGKCNVTEYATTLVETTAITKFFKTSGVSGFTKGIISVVTHGVSDNGHTFEWDYTTGAFKCYKPTAATTVGIVNSTGGVAMEFNSAGGNIFATAAAGTLTIASAAAASEAASAADVGSVSFVAIGFI